MKRKPSADFDAPYWFRTMDVYSRGTKTRIGFVDPARAARSAGKAPPAAAPMLDELAMAAVEGRKLSVDGD